MPSVTVPRFKEDGVSLIAVPIPTRVTICGLPGALSLNVKLPWREPFAVGLNTTPTAQLVPADKVAPQGLLEIAKSPLGVILEMLSVVVPVLVNVTLFGLLVTPMTVVGKLNFVRESVTVGAPPALQLLKANDPMWELQLNEPFTFSYWFVYQNVQSSLGST